MESGFNPVPKQTTFAGTAICVADSQSCPGFSVGNATLRELNRTDIESQTMTFTVTSEEAAPMTKMVVYIDNVSLGTVDGPFSSKVSSLVALGVPTTISVTPGVSYRVVFEGVFSASVEYWQSISVVATGG